MRIGVEHADLEELLEIRFGQPVGQALAIDGGVAVAEQGLQVPAGQLFESQHAGPGEVPADHGHADAFLVGERLADARGGRGFADEVHLAAQRLRQLLDKLARSIGAQFGQEVLGRLGEPVEDVHVQGDDAFDVRASHLHHHVHAVERGGAIDLSDGAARKGRFVHLAERLCHGHLEFVLDDAARDGRIERRHLVLQAAQLLERFERDEIGPRGERLGQLHEGGPELFADACEPASDGRGTGGYGLVLGSLSARAQHGDVPAEVQAVDHVPESVLREHPHDVLQTIEASDAAGELKWCHGPRPVAAERDRGSGPSRTRGRLDRGSASVSIAEDGTGGNAVGRGTAGGIFSGTGQVGFSSGLVFALTAFFAMHCRKSIQVHRVLTSSIVAREGGP